MKYKFNTILIAMILALTNINISNAQNFIAATTNDLIANNNVQNTVNTGNDIIYYDQDFFQVTVWDGDLAMLGWDIGSGPKLAFKLDGTNRGTCKDPDVVLHTVNNRVYAFIIYLIKNDVWIEVHEYYQGNWSTYVSATQISSNSICHNPNVDVDNAGNVVAVWEQDNKLKILYTDIQYSNSSIHTLLDGGNNTLRDPDVAIYYRSSTNAKIVVCYILTSQTSEALTLIGIDSWQTSVNSNFLNYLVSLPDYFGKPRVATSLYTSSSAFNFEIVEDKHQGTDNYIIGFNYQGNGVSGPTIINPLLEEYENNAPAVSFAASSNNISVVWENNSFWSNQIDIIQKKLDNSGNLLSATDYQVVNKVTSDDQIIPSVSGKNSNGNSILYSFFDMALNEIRYKVSNIANNSVRIGHYNKPALISPNPATDYIKLNLGQEIEVAKIVIYDASGRIVLENDNFELNYRIQTDNFEQGVYFIRITADNYNKTSKFIIL